MNILIVDDMYENRLLFREMLHEFGQCDMASDGIDAVQMFEMELTSGEPYELVILDIMMPNMDGEATLKKLRQIEQENGITGSEEAVIIMVTAMNSPRSVLNTFFHGCCTDYIIKPVSKEALLEKIQLYGLTC